MEASNYLKTVRGIEILPQGNFFILVEPTTASWAIVNKEFLKLLEEMKEGMTFNELCETFNNKENLHSVLEQLFASNMMEVNGNIRFPKDLFFRISYSLPSLFVLKLTYACNKKCQYCYTTGYVSRIESMSKDLIERIIDEILLLPKENFYIGFHGGEPLLKEKVMRMAVEYGEERAQVFGKKISFLLQTNGTLISPDLVDFLKKHKFSIGVSFAGTPLLNDKYRKYKDGKSSTMDTLKGMGLLLENKMPFTMLSVIYESKDISQILKWAVKEKVFHIRFLPLITYKESKQGLNYSQSAQRLFAQEIINSIDLVVYLYKSESIKLIVDNILDIYECLFTKERTNMCMRTPCGAGSCQLAITPDGCIFPCDDMIGVEEMSLGKISSLSKGSLGKEFLSSTVIKSLFKRQVHRTKKCQQCIWRYFCGGGCASMALQNKGHLLETDGFCEYKRKVFEGFLRKIYENPEIIDVMESLYGRYERN